MSPMHPLVINTPPFASANETPQAAKGGQSISSQEAAALVQKPSTPGNELPGWYIPQHGGTAVAQLGTATAAIHWFLHHAEKCLTGSLADLTVNVHVQSQCHLCGNAGGLNSAPLNFAEMHSFNLCLLGFLKLASQFGFIWIAWLNFSSPTWGCCY